MWCFWWYARYNNNLYEQGMFFAYIIICSLYTNSCAFYKTMIAFSHQAFVIGEILTWTDEVYKIYFLYTFSRIAENARWNVVFE